MKTKVSYAFCNNYNDIKNEISFFHHSSKSNFHQKIIRLIFDFDGIIVGKLKYYFFKRKFHILKQFIFFYIEKMKKS